MASSNQIVTNGFVNGSATAYVATATPTVVHATAGVQAYHPYPQQVRQVCCEDLCKRSSRISSDFLYLLFRSPLLPSRWLPLVLHSIQPLPCSLLVMGRHQLPSNSRRQYSSSPLCLLRIPLLGTQDVLLFKRHGYRSQCSLLPLTRFKSNGYYILKLILGNSLNCLIQLILSFFISELLCFFLNFISRYIESLHHGSQRTVSKWNRSVLINRRNLTSQKPLPLNWLKVLIFVFLFSKLFYSFGSLASPSLSSVKRSSFRMPGVTE